MKRNGNANWGAEGGGVWGGGIPSPVGEGSRKGAVPPPQKFFWFFCLAMVHFDAFWALVLMLVGPPIRHVKQSRKAVLCANCQLVSYLTWRTYHPWYHTHKHIYQSQQSDAHAAYTMDIVDIHVHATIYLYVLLSCILFQEIQLLFTKVTVCWWHVYFYKHISGVWSVIKFRWSTAGSKRISFITEGLPWKITVNNCSMQKKNNGKKTLRSRLTRILITVLLGMSYGPNWWSRPMGL